jgi:magnesium transporter
MKRAGTAPGTLIHLGEKKQDIITISVIDYTKSALEERECDSIEESFPYKDKKSISWINVDGLHDLTVFEKVGAHFGIHRLVLEDCLNTRQRPKMDDHDSYIFVVLKMLYLDPERRSLQQEQVSVLFTEDLVLTFQEQEGDVFSIVRERIRIGKGLIRKAKADYLAYAIVDAVVDNYFLVVDHFNERIEALDAVVVNEPSPEVLQEIYALKREVVTFRKHVAPLREVLRSLSKADPKLVKQETAVYFDDVYDHLLQVLESIDANREVLSGLIDLYISVIGQQTNEVMKVLTLMAAIFIPITFVAGVYGMNFEIIPELQWKYGYVYVWSLMLFIVFGMLIYFKKNRWL